MRVSTLMRSPSLMYSGTCTVKPVSITAGLLREVAELPRIEGSHWAMFSSTGRRECQTDTFIFVDQGVRPFQFLSHIVELFGRHRLPGW